MENYHPFLSIVVPTKNRYFYLKYLIQQVERLNSNEVELVIQDNSDENREFIAYLNENNYSFVKYDYVKGSLPICENVDKALSRACGEYVCMLGDDDGFTKYTLDCAHWMKENDIEVVKPSDLYYFWPDANSGLRKERTATIRYHSFSATINYVSAYDEIIKVLDKGIVDRGRMAMVYHSIVKKEVLDQVFEKCGTYAPGNSPDISNAVALSLIVKKYAIINLPLSYSGSSVQKGGGVTAPGKKYPPMIEDIPFWKAGARERWFSRLPKIAVGSIIWADSAISALKAMGREDLIDKVNFDKAYMSFAVAHPKEKNYVMEFYPNRMLFWFKYMLAYFKMILDAIHLKLGWQLGFIPKYLYKSNIENTLEASKWLEEESHDKCAIFNNH
jgi:glycosyltransferase involved in cell wall biosynthesis